MNKQSIARTLLALMISVLTIFSGSAVFGADSTVTVEINGKSVVFSDQQPIIKDGRTLVPVRGVFEQLGYNVSWEQSTNTATLSNGLNTVAITVGSSTFITNGKAYALDVPAQIINGRTMLPFRAVLESIGCSVDWNSGRNTVIVSTNASKPDTQASITVDKSTPFSNGVAAVETGGKWGLIDNKGELVSEFVWDSMELPPSGNNSNIAALSDLLSSDGVLVKVSQDGKYGLIDTKGNIIVKAVWDNVGASPLTWDEFFIGRSYEYVTGSTDGMIPVKLNDKWGFIAKNTGDVAIAPRFEEHDGIVPFFSEGLALVYINEEYCFINKTGDVVITGHWNDVSPFINGFAAFTLNGELGIIDTNGKVLTKLKGSLVDIPSGTSGRFLIKTDEGNIIIDQYGNVLIPAQPTTWRPKFSNGLTAVYKDGATNIVGAADIDGNIILSYETYENSSVPFGMKLTAGNDGKTYILLYRDLQQMYGFPSPYISLDVIPYSDSLMPLLDFKDGKFGFTDKDGNAVIDYNYEMAMPFVNGIALAGSRDSGGFINRDGTLLPIDYTDPAYDSNPLAGINEPVGTGLFDNLVQGRSYFPDGMRYIYQNGKFGYVDTVGQIVIAPIWDAASNFSNGFALVQKGDTYSYIDTTGRAIVSFKELP